jgi:DNA-binding Lrp family transcriptional regulator
MFALCILDVSGDVEEVLALTKKAKGVKDAFIVFGGHDLVALLNAKDLNEIRQVVFEIRRIRGVTKTETLIEV